MEKTSELFELKGSQLLFKSEIIGTVDYKEYSESIARHLASDTEDEKRQHVEMNAKRMQRWDKILQIESDFSSYLKELKQNLLFFIITEPWCGDAAHAMPLMDKIVTSNSNFSMKIVYRDKHPEIMDQYLTNGNRSIPIIVVFEIKDGELKQAFKWGAKPKPLVDLLQDYKEGKLNLTYDEFQIETQKWYNKDQTKTTQKEIYQLMRNHF